ncbi:hypothetical protein ACJRO7_016889, partial [Eucalyptus globulus]
SADEARSAMLAIRPVMLVTDENCISWYSVLLKDGIPSLKWHVSLGSLSWPFSSNVNVSTMGMLDLHPITPPSSFSTTDYVWACDGAVIICFPSPDSLMQSMAKEATVGMIYALSILSSAMAMLLAGACHVIEKHDVTALITILAMVADLIPFSVMLFRWYFCLIPSFLGEKGPWKGKDCVEEILNEGGSLLIDLIKEAGNFFLRAKILSACEMTETYLSLTFMTLYDPHFPFYYQPPHFHIRTDLNSVQRPRAIWGGKPAPHVKLTTDSDDSIGIGKILE